VLVWGLNFPDWNWSKISLLIFPTTPSRISMLILLCGLEEEPSLSFRMRTEGTSFANKLQQHLSSPNLSNQQRGRHWLGPKARIPTGQELGWGFLPGPLELDLWMDDRQGLYCFPWNKQTCPG
jgi:hypothetical protein